MSRSEQKIEELKDQILQLQEEIKNISEDNVAEIKDRAKEVYESAKKKFDDTRDKTVELGKRTDRYVHENPWQVVAVSVLVGMVLGGIIINSRK